MAEHRLGTDILGLEPKLSEAANLLRGDLDALQHQRVILGLLFLKYVSDVGRADQQEKLTSKDKAAGEGLPSFRVPKEAEWAFLSDSSRNPRLGTLLDSAMRAVERENPELKGVLPREFHHPTVPSESLGRLIEILSDLEMTGGDPVAPGSMGEVYEYFLSRFAAASGKGAGEFYTPRSLVRLLVALLQPTSGRVYDPCCGSGGTLLYAAQFAEDQGGSQSDLKLFGQEVNSATRQLAQMNLAMCGVSANLGPTAEDSFGCDLHPDLEADFAFAIPPFNLSDWGREELLDDPRWMYGVPPRRNANFAWLQHVVHHLNPSGTAAVVLANHSLFSRTSGEADIRRKLVLDDLVDCIIACPGQLFHSTGIPVSIWILTTSKTATSGRDRTGETLFIDARKLGRKEGRAHRAFGAKDINRIAKTYRDWRTGTGGYSDISGFCRAAQLDEVEDNGFVLTPADFVGPDIAERETIASVVEELAAISRAGGNANLVSLDIDLRAKVCATLIESIPDLNLIRIDAQRRDWAQLWHLRNRLAHPARPVGQTLVLIENWSPQNVASTGGWAARGKQSDPDEAERWSSAIVLAATSREVAVVVGTDERIAALQADAKEAVIPNRLLGEFRIVDVEQYAPAPTSLIDATSDNSYALALHESFAARLAETDKLHTALDAAPPDYRSALFLNIARNLPVEEIAAKLALGTDEVRKQLAILNRGQEATSDFSREFGRGELSEIQAKLGAIWERFLRQLCAEHPWLNEEIEALGFSFNDDTRLASFLGRREITAPEFAASLFRPSDIRRIFGDFDPAKGVQGQLEEELQRFLENE